MTYRTKFVPREQYEIVRHALEGLLDMGVVDDENVEIVFRKELEKAEAMELEFREEK